MWQKIVCATHPLVSVLYKARVEREGSEEAFWNPLQAGNQRVISLHRAARMVDEVWKLCFINNDRQRLQSAKLPIVHIWQLQICNMSQHVPTSLLMQRWKLGQSWHTVGSYVDQVYRWHQIAAVSCVRSCDICLSSKHQAWKVSGAQSAKQEFFFRQHSIAFQRWSKIHQIPGRNITVCIPGFVPCVSMRRHTFYNQNCAANAFLLPSLGRWFHIV